MGSLQRWQDILRSGVNSFTSSFGGVYKGHNDQRLERELGYKRRGIKAAIMKYEEQVYWFGKNNNQQRAKTLLKELETSLLRDFEKTTL